MKLTACIAVLALGGCAATQSALGALTGSKPPQVTVQNQINVQPARAAEPARQASRPTAAMITGGVAGAVAGGIASASLRGDAITIAGGAVLGAGVGTALGYVIHEATD